MRKIVIPLLAFFFIFSGCTQYGTDNLFYSGNYVHNRADDILELNEDWTSSLPDEYSFVLITDVHYGSTKVNPPDIPEEAFLAWLSKLPDTERPQFCLVLGDVAETGREGEFIGYKEFEDKITAQGLKVFSTVGNHDLYQSGWDNWKKYCYPYTSFYTFKTPSFSFYSLDTGTDFLGSKQLMALKYALERDSSPKIIFTHYPLVTDSFFFGMNNTTERNLLLSLFAENNVKLYVSGHLHLYEEKDYKKFQTYVIPSFRYDGKWGLVKVNGTTEKYSLKIIEADN